MRLSSTFQHILPSALLLLFALSTLSTQENMDDAAQVVKRHLEELPDIKDANFSEYFDRFGDAKVSNQSHVYASLSRLSENRFRGPLLSRQLFCNFIATASAKNPFPPFPKVQFSCMGTKSLIALVKTFGIA